MQTWCSVNNKNSRKSFEYHHLILVSSRMRPRYMARMQDTDLSSRKWREDCERWKTELKQEVAVTMML